MTLKREDIRIRDPFVLTDKAQKCYYMYGTTALRKDTIKGNATFSVYKSYDLENFEEPVVVFDGEECDFWTKKDYWAPEVHLYNGKYYLIGTFGYGDKNMRVQILVSDSPTGKFKPFSAPLTPEGEMCLDGTLFIEEGDPYLVYTSIGKVGETNQIYAMRLSKDLKIGVSERKFLFSKASYMSAIQQEYIEGAKNLDAVAEGAFLYKENGLVRMLWSGYSKRYPGNYCVYQSTASSLLGEWTHSERLIYTDNGGHCMLFTDLNGKRRLVLHTPNTPAGEERACFIPFFS